MINNFEQVHNEWLEPKENTEKRIEVGLDWLGYPYYEDDDVYEMENGDIVLNDDKELLEWAREQGERKVWL